MAGARADNEGVNEGVSGLDATIIRGNLAASERFRK